MRADSEAEMIELGEEFSEQLEAGDVIALVGDLGAGKTHFCKGIARGLDSDEDVTSPTFALVNEYRAGRLPVFHFDFYRMENVGDLEEIGWEEYIDDDGVLLVEWADKFPDALPPEARWLRFSVADDGSRSIVTD